MITEADNIPTAPPVLVIDENVARDLYPGKDPLGTLEEAVQRSAARPSGGVAE